MDLALLSVLRDGLLRLSETHLLTWTDVEFRNNGTALLQLHRSKTDQESEGVVVYIGKQAADAINAIRPAEELPDPVTRSSASHPDRSAGECKQRPRLRALERVSPDTAAALAWPKTWPPPGLSCRR